MSGRTSLKVAVLMGGPSSEREVSLSSGTECAKALRAAGHEVVEIDAGRDLPAKLGEVAPDVAFNALHGRWGEDGVVQGLLEWMRMPYTHSGVLASALAMDKTRAKEIMAAHGVPVLRGGLFDKADVAARHVMPPPYVVKPNAEGSSVGIYIVGENPNGPPAIAEDMPDTLLVEAYGKGRELTVTVLGDRALTVTEIVTPDGGWYDYHAKYATGGSSHVLPAEVPEDVFEACRAHALTAHRAMGCRGVTRTDFRWDESRGLDGLFALEINTQPGMTPTSLVPEQAAHDGIDFPALCDWIARDASCDR